MNVFIVFLISFSLSDSMNESQNNLFQHTELNKSDKYYDKIGFYNTEFGILSTVTISFSGGRNRIFVFFPKVSYHTSVSIDDNLFYDLRGKIGFSLEGKKHAIIKSSFAEVNFWIIPSTICPKNSIFVYGSRTIEIQMTHSPFCVFSPIFDSNNGYFKVKTGIKNHKGFHYSNIYTTNFTYPQFTNFGNINKTHKVKTSHIAEFYVDMSSSKRYDLYYERKVSYFSFKAHSYEDCYVNHVIYCNATTCESRLWSYYPYCSNFDILLLIRIFLLVLTSICAMAFIFKMCLNKKESKDTLNTIPLKSDNTYEKVDDSSYTQLQGTTDSNAQSQHSEKINQC